MKFNNGKQKSLCLWRSNPRHQYMLGSDKLGSSSAENRLGVLVASWLTVSWLSTLTAKEVSSILGWTRRSVVLSAQHWLCCIWCVVSSSRLPIIRKVGVTGVSPVQVHKTTRIQGFFISDLVARYDMMECFRNRSSICNWELNPSLKVILQRSNLTS